MIIGNGLDRARSALEFIPADLPCDQWLKVGMGLHAAGGILDDFDQWSAQAASYSAHACRVAWRSFKSGKGIGAGTLFAVAREHGYEPNGKPQQRPMQATRKAAEPPRKFVTGTSAAELWERCEAATNAHPYIVKKHAAGVSLDSLRVLPAGDSLTIGGERMAGSLVVPVMQADGTISSLQFIAPPDVAERLKVKGMNDKLNLPGHQVNGRFIVGELKPGGVAYLCEGIGTAWACWQATGDAAVVCFGAGNMGKVAKASRQQDAAARLVLVPDVGKESDAEKIALEVGARVAYMPKGEPRNFDACDLAQRDGAARLADLLEAATKPPKPAPRYKLFSGADLAALQPVQWRVRNVLSAVGLAGLYGPSASGKSFLAWDMAAAIAEGSAWFGNRVKAAPVVYAALEGEAGFKLRAQA
jgi:putative DNA primase/helicase